LFDPTVYENLKVVLEGSVYDLDLAGTIRVTAREDSINLAAMSRSYRIAFRLVNEASTASGETLETDSVYADIALSTELKDLASEILEVENSQPGCSLNISFVLQLPSTPPVEHSCKEIHAALQRVWGGRFAIRQTLSYDYGDPSGPVTNRIRLLFGRRFGEEVAGDFQQIIDHTVLSLQEITAIPSD